MRRPDPDIRDPFLQNLASFWRNRREIQKLTPSLHAPKGAPPDGKPNTPAGVRSAAFQRETVLPLKLVSRTRSPSKAAWTGPFRPFPVNVASTDPVEARTTETEWSPSLGTQMLVPSKTGFRGMSPTVTVWITAPALSSLKRFPEASVPSGRLETRESATHMLAPSKAKPLGTRNPVVAVVTLQGSDGPGVTIATEESVLEIHTRAPSKAIGETSCGRPLATRVTAPGACFGSIR